MKKFNLKEAVKNLNEKLKNDKKFKARFATLTVAGSNRYSNCDNRSYGCA